MKGDEAGCKREASPGGQVVEESSAVVLACGANAVLVKGSAYQAKGIIFIKAVATKFSGVLGFSGIHRIWIQEIMQLE